MLLRNLKELQAYPNFKTAEGINQVKEAVRTNTLPAGLNGVQRKKFRERFLSGDFVVEDVITGELSKPSYGNKRLKYRVDDKTFIVAYPDERDFILEKIWKDPRRGYGVGLQAFYLQVAQSHLNIQKKYTDAFLKDKGDYQIQKVPVKKVNNPVISKTSNERWGMDLISMIQDNNSRYIFSVVDNFSGFLWTRLITNKEATTIVDKLRDIIERDVPEGSGGASPRILQSDQGPEFNNAAVRAFCQEYNIKLLLSKSYSPSANGKIERKNREIRKKIKAGFIRNNKLRWSAAKLNDYTQNINRQVDLRSKFRAVDLYEPEYDPPGKELPSSVPLANDNTEQEIQHINRNYHRNRAIRLTNGQRNVFKKGDLVRVNFAAVSDEYRRIRKEKLGANKIAIHYSPVVSRVVKVLEPDYDKDRFVKQYSLAVGTEDGLPPPPDEPEWTLGDGNSRTPYLFTGSQLVKAGDIVSVNPKSVNRVNKINSSNG